jgi:hypothetical protein
MMRHPLDHLGCGVQENAKAEAGLANSKGESLAISVRDGLGDNADVGNAGLAEFVDYGCKGTEGNGLVGSKKNGVAGMLELLFDFGGEVVDVDGIVAKVDQLFLVDGDDETHLGDFLYGVSFGDVDFDARLEDRGSDHEDDEQDEDNVDERHHVDVGEGRLRGFGEVRHGSV